MTGLSYSGKLDYSGTGTISALNGAVITYTQDGRSLAAFTITGTWVATITIEATIDGTTWFTTNAIDQANESELSSFTTNKNIIVPCGSFSQVRLIASAYTSGTISVAYDLSVANNDEDPTYANNGALLPSQSQLIGGSDGTNIYPLATDNLGRLITSDLTGFGANFVFGDVTLAAIAQAVVRRTVYTEQTTNAQRSIASASALDTAAGTGAQQVTIIYYTSTGSGPFTEVVTLNGTAYVNTVSTNICFIEDIKVSRVGSTGANAGIITLKAATAGGGATIWTIAAGNNQTFGAHHYIPLGKTCNITGISCSHSGTTVGSGGVFVMKSKPINLTGAVEIQVSDFVRLYGQSSTFSRVYQSPIKVVGPARLTMFVTPETASSTIYRSAVDFFEP